MQKNKRCECCGKYFINSDAKDNKNYCSIECETQYVRCTVCGDYYKAEKNIDIKNFICSSECAKKFKFKKQRHKDKLDFSKLH